LYSTNVWLKYQIQYRYRNDTHYVWCGETYDSRALGRYTPGASTPPTSNPAEIYDDLKQACSRSDLHNGKIKEQRAGLKARAVEWERNGEIITSDKDDIIYLVDNATFKEWRPLIYIIPVAVVQSRLQVVPIAKRASPSEMEFIIPDLKTNEFHIIEP
jgi:hypothetical protein